jgi:hypothetical protein
MFLVFFSSIRRLPSTTVRVVRFRSDWVSLDYLNAMSRHRLSDWCVVFFCIYTSFALIFLILVYYLLIRKIATLSLRASSNNPKPIFVFLLLFTNLQSCGVGVSLFLQTEFVSSNGIVKSKETIREKNLYNLIVSNKW